MDHYNDIDLNIQKANQLVLDYEALAKCSSDMQTRFQYQQKEMEEKSLLIEELQEKNQDLAVQILELREQAKVADTVAHDQFIKLQNAESEKAQLLD